MEVKDFAKYIEIASQSLHFLRAFQLDCYSLSYQDFIRESRNPFIFLGHFNLPSL